MQASGKDVVGESLDLLPNSGSDASGCVVSAQSLCSESFAGAVAMGAAGGEFESLQSSEMRAKRRVVRLQRQLLTARAQHAMQVTRESNLAKAAAARAEMDKLLSRDIAASLSAEPMTCLVSPVSQS